MAKPSHKGFSRSVHAKHIPEPDLFDIGAVEQELKPMLISIIEKAFIRFCHGHKLGSEQIAIELHHFKKILERML